MFKSARWRGEKNRVKEVFKLQFHATQVSQPGIDALTISLVPGDVGKPTLRLEKAIVRDRTCKWENPVYETVKFIKELKTGKINERTYHFIVSSVSPKGSFVIGEATIDLAEYAEATKASSVSLPLKSVNSNSNIVLHISIHRLQEASNEREMEETDGAKLKAQDRSLKSRFNIGDADDSVKNSSIEDEQLNKPELNTQLNGNSRESSGSDITTLSSSETSSELNTPRVVPHKATENPSSTIHEEHQRSSSHWVWSEGSDPGLSTDDSTSSSQQASDMEIEKLKTELAAMARQADVTELELQTLRKQIVKESKRGQDLAKEVMVLKEERYGLEKECERLKASQRHGGDERRGVKKFQIDGSVLEEMRQELDHEKGLNANLRIQLQKTQEANSELVLAVQDLDEMLEQKEKEMKRTEHGNEDEEKKIVDLYREINMYRRDRDELEAQMEQLALDYEILKQENHDISYRLEQSELQEQLKMQCECPSLEIELKNRSEEFLGSLASVKELEGQVEILQNELKNRSEELLGSLGTVKELEGEVESLERKFDKQSEELSGSLATVKELEDNVEILQSELKNRSEELLGSLGTVKELEGEVEILQDELKNRSEEVEVLQNELKNRSEEYLGSVATVKELEGEVEILQDELKNRSEEVEFLQDELRNRSEEVEILQNELKNRSKELLGSLANVKELEGEVESLESKLKKQSEEISGSLANVEELESNITTLEEELERQSQEFEAGVEALTLAKVEQEQRAIRAEEALRKTRWRNADMAEKLQKEFQRLSVQMASTFEENEKVVMKALKEASELRLQKSQLEETIKKANEMIDDKSKQLESQMKNEEEVKDALSKSILTLESEVDKLTEEQENWRALSEKMKSSIEELVSRVDLLKNEADKSMEELKIMTRLKDEKEAEVEMLKGQCNDLMGSLSVDESEKEKLRKQVFQLKDDMKKKSDALSVLEKKLKDYNGTRTILRSNKAMPVPRYTKEVENMREKIKLLEGQIMSKEAALETSSNLFLEKEKDLQNKIEELESRMEELDQNNADFCDSLSLKDELLTELSSLKEKNASMESELKEMQERYSEISLKFAEVEGERQRLVMTVRSLKNSKRIK